MDWRWDVTYKKKPKTKKSFKKSFTKFVNSERTTRIAKKAKKFIDKTEKKAIKSFVKSARSKKRYHNISSSPRDQNIWR